MPWLNVEENIKIHEEEHKIDVDNILSLVSLNDIKNFIHLNFQEVWQVG